MQTKLKSFMESLTQVAIGFTVSILGGFIIYPICGINVSHGENILVAVWFTGLSLIRQYVVRRWFNKKS